MEKSIEIQFSSNSAMLRQIVNRCHVSDSNLKVIKYAISRFKHKYKTYKSFSRQSRKSFIQAIIQIHLNNLLDYSIVMKGGLS